MQTEKDYREQQIIGVILHKPETAYSAFSLLESEYFGAACSESGRSCLNLNYKARFVQKADFFLLI